MLILLSAWDTDRFSFIDEGHISLKGTAPKHDMSVAYVVRHYHPGLSTSLLLLVGSLLEIYSNFFCRTNILLANRDDFLKYTTVLL